MTTKAELIARLEELIAQPDVEAAAEAVEATKEAYEALVAAEREHAHAEIPAEAEAVGVGEESPTPAVALPMENAPLNDEEDKRFKQLLDSFNQKVNDLRRKKAKDEADNLNAKRALMEELKTMISSEENIGTAFNRFKELQEKWKTIGPVPGNAYRELQSDYSHLLDEFFYHIRIYKELRDHDLRKNTALKQALISDMNALGLQENIRDLENGVREYQEKWHQVGAVLKEEWETIRDGFHNATRVVYDKINEHYKARRAEHEANLEAKQALVDKVKALTNEMVVENSQGWKTLTDQVLELQNAWKSVGFATKKENERIWKEFRDACNVFFDAKKGWYDKLRDQYKGARDKKQSLISQAVALKDSTDWRQTADKLKSLQAQWKEAGSAGPRDENKLWNRFREACDAFFQNRKQTFEKQDAEQAGNVQIKETLIAEIEAYQLSGDRNKDIETFKGFSLRWMNSGRVSP
ncbi:MAG TPA: DUF349 domain-containing protein, partial [Flavobacteriales bacterium]|nr:DUF349 domain-containing protein [Flavobacteriales bacterium]